MVGWHHRLNGHESEQTPGGSEGQRSLACCSPWGHKESDRTERLNTTTATMDATTWIPQGSAFLSLPPSRAQSLCTGHCLCWRLICTSAAPQGAQPPWLLLEHHPPLLSVLPSLGCSSTGTFSPAAEEIGLLGDHKKDHSWVA